MKSEITKELVHDLAVDIVDKFEGSYNMPPLAKVEQLLTEKLLPEEYEVVAFDSDGPDGEDLTLKLLVTDDTIKLFFYLNPDPEGDGGRKNKNFTIDRKTKSISQFQPSLKKKL